MVGINPTDEDGQVVPLRVEMAKQQAGLTKYETEWVELQEKMNRYEMPQAGRINIPIRDPSLLPEAANILHRLANEITALASQHELSDFSKLFELFHKIRSSDDRLKMLGK